MRSAESSRAIRGPDRPGSALFHRYDEGSAVTAGDERSGLIDSRRVWSRIDWAALAAVTAGAAILRLVGLARPIGFVFDEIFYAQNGCLYTLGLLASWSIPQAGTLTVALLHALFRQH